MHVDRVLQENQVLVELLQALLDALIRRGRRGGIIVVVTIGAAGPLGGERGSRHDPATVRDEGVHEVAHVREAALAQGVALVLHQPQPVHLGQRRHVAVLLQPGRPVVVVVGHRRRVAGRAEDTTVHAFRAAVADATSTAAAAAAAASPSVPAALPP